MKPMGKKYTETVERLEELLNDEHVCGCGQTSCDINASYEHGSTLWAVQLFDWTGASSPEFKKLMRKLPKRFKADAEHERKIFVLDVEHYECPHCNAVNWGDGVESCDSCGESKMPGYLGGAE